ncbi:MAG: maleylpyruvate isomerase family mycothiol-dependent enzyme [Acidimicrobiales bacterium]
MENAPEPWILALRHSHDALSAVAETLGNDRLQSPSYDSDWSIAQVLSHLGSGAEIFALILDAGVSGDEPPSRESFPAIWDAWNSRSPEAQAADALERDGVLVAKFEALDAAQLGRLHLELFGRDVDSAGVARMRLSEHAIHTWDIAVALDPGTEVAPDAVELLVDTLDVLVARTGKAGSKKKRVRVTTSNPGRQFVLEIAASVTLTAGSVEEPLPHLQLPAEAFVRLVYGRLDPAHTPAVEVDGIELEELRGVFPGF